jgi:hypothetical protein
MRLGIDEAGFGPAENAAPSFRKSWALQALRNNLIFLGYEVDPSSERAIVQTAMKAIDDLRPKGPCEEAMRRAGRYADGVLRAGIEIAGIVLEEVRRE